MARAAELLEAALRAIRLHGVGTSIEQVASEAGITRPVIYRYFGDAAGLYRAVADWFAEELMARSADATRGIREGQALVRAQVDAYLGFLESEPNVYRFLTRQVPERAADVEDPVAGFVQHLGGLIADFIAAGTVPTASAQVAGRAFVGAIHTVSEWWLEDRELSRAELTDELVRVLWDGMRAAVAAPTATGRS